MLKTNKINFINNNKDHFSFIPLKATSGKTKEAAVMDWQQYCHKLSSFDNEQLIHNNVGIVTGRASNLIVLDIDDQNLFKSFINRNNFNIDKSYMVKTGRGYHLYFRYPDDENDYTCRSSKIFGFDIRAMGGYIVAPYSIHEETGREYELVSEGVIPDPPGWLLEHCLNGSKSSAPNIDKIKNPEIIDLIKYGADLGKRSEAIMKVLNSMVSHRLNDDQIFYIFNTCSIGEKYLEKADSSRDQWLQGQIDKAREYIGTIELEDDLPENENIPAITYLNANELLQKECKVEWLVDDLLEKGGHTIITGRSGVGKSMFILNLALTLASAAKDGLMGHTIANQLKIVVIQCENSEPFVAQRIHSLCKINPLYDDGKENIEFVYFNDRYDYPNIKLSNDNLDGIITQIYKDKKPDLIILDPYKSYSGVAENDNDRNREVLDKFFYILGNYGITSIIVHHEGKSSEYHGTNRSRGASTITDTVSNHWTINRNKDKDTGMDQLVVGCAKARNYKKFDDIYLETVDGVYFKQIADQHDPKRLIDLLMYNNGEPVGTQTEMLELIINKMGVNSFKARQLLKEAVSKKYIIKEKYGQNKIRYALPVTKIAA